MDGVGMGQRNGARWFGKLGGAGVVVELVISGETHQADRDYILKNFTSQR